MFSNGFWIEVLLSKFLHGMPLYRIIKSLEMENLFVSQGTLTGGLKKIGELLQPLYAAILERSRAARHWHMDETRWMVFVELAGKANHRWWLWVISTADTCAYIIDPSRSAEVPRNHLGPDAEGIISADRYSAYQALGKNISVAFCWAHVRRDFIRVRDGNRKLAPWGEKWIARIDDLFRINSKRMKAKVGSKEFESADHALRVALERMKQTRDSELASQTVHSAKRKALKSLHKHWQGLTIFVDHPEIPMDNNEAERRIRPAVIGRKNYYGNGSIWSGMLSAVAFTIIQTMLLNNINPKQFFLSYFDACARNSGRSPEDINDFLPWNLSDETKSEWQYQERAP